MKRFLYFFLVVFFLWGCDKNITQPAVPAVHPSLIQTKSEGDDYFDVKMEDVSAYLKFTELSRGKKLDSVKPVDYGDETVMYIINYDNGWEIVSGDKRAPVILAHSDTSSFSLNTKNEEMLSWIESLGADVLSINQSDYDLSLLNDNQSMKSSLDFWSLINSEIEYPGIQTKSISDPPGHWELCDVDIDTVYVEGNKLTQTRWAQDENLSNPSYGRYFNRYCPLRSDTTDGSRAPAGCVAIAGAQILYYLHQKWSVPVFAPDSVQFSGSVGSSFLMDTYGNSTITWRYMLRNALNDKSFYSAAVLISDVGKRLNMNYGNSVSLASTQDLVNDVFVPYGINCSYDNYNESTINASLKNEIPVIVRADGTCNHFLWIPSYHDGHSFIIDGYTGFQLKYTYYYEWFYDETPTGVVPYYRPRTEIEYSSPYITEYRMNWGWCDSYDFAYYAPSGNWLTGDYNFVYNRKMIHDFSLINN